MAGLGTYTVNANLFGGISVSHDTVKDLTGDFESEAVFKIKLQKSDWSRMMVALLSLIGIAGKIQSFGYIPTNENHFHFINTSRTYATEISKDAPDKIAEKLKYIIDFMPRFAITRNNRMNIELMKEHAIVKDYYDRYLQRWDIYNNPTLTA